MKNLWNSGKAGQLLIMPVLSFMLLTSMMTPFCPGAEEFRSPVLRPASPVVRPVPVATLPGLPGAEGYIEIVEAESDEAEETEPVEIVKVLEAPTQDEIEQCVRQFNDASPVVREEAIRRLLPFPQVASELTVLAFQDGNLSTRLSAMELLKEWKAPLDQVDPWQPTTLTPERSAALEAWQKETAKSTVPTPQLELTAEQRTEAAAEIARMLNASDTEAEAIRERLARWGAVSLPLVYDKLKTVTTDHDRQRLQALRYRLVAGETLTKRWPEGLLRLASPETVVRQKSAEELANLAIAEDQMLLRELFSDPDPLVREICLRGMQKIGGETQTLLLDLLGDPEPNVRAAVLKQLEEKPGPGASLKITEYVKTEKDPDLVGHAVRVLRTLHKQEDSKATRSLMELLKHERWQVRSEAAMALGSDSRYYSSYDNRKLSAKEQLQVDVYIALIELLEDDDNFVVSKAVESMANIDMPAAVEPLVKVIPKHPDLAGSVVEILSKGSNMRAKAKSQLRNLSKHEDPRVRAAVLRGVAGTDEEGIREGITDTDSRVRIAAANALFVRLESMRMVAQLGESRTEMVMLPSPMPQPVNPIGQFFRAIGGSLAKAKKTAEAEGESNEGDSIEVIEEEIVLPPAILEVTPEEAEMDPFADTGGVDTIIRVEEQETEMDPFADTERVATIVQVEEQEENPSETASEEANNDDLLAKYFANSSSKVSSDAYDQWLLDFDKGVDRPDWANEMVEPLEKMLEAESLEERIAAASALIPLGKKEAMVPLLMEMTKDKPEFSDSFVKVVPWLVREKRWELFHQWQEQTKPQDEQIAQFLRNTVDIVDIVELRDEAIFWDILDRENISIYLLDTVFDSLKPLYLFREFAYNSGTQPPKKIRSLLIEKLQARATTGPENQRLTALALLLPIDGNKAQEIAQQLDADTSFSAEFRRDMLQIQFFSQTNEKARTELAMEVLKQNDPLRSKLALLSLTDKRDSLRILRRSLYLYQSNDFSRSNYGQEKTLKMPRGLELESIKPLISDENEEIAAYAGYFTVLLGDPSGMEPLLKYWRKSTTKATNANSDSDGMEGYGVNSSINSIAYSAIASLDDPQYIPILREIYGKLGEYEVRDFYWTIRSMTGPEILKFRKELRDKHGMENLR